MKNSLRKNILSSIYSKMKNYIKNEKAVQKTYDSLQKLAPKWS